MKTCFHLGQAKEIKPCLFVQRYDKAKREETDIAEMGSSSLQTIMPEDSFIQREEIDISGRFLYYVCGIHL